MVVNVGYWLTHTKKSCYSSYVPVGTRFCMAEKERGNGDGKSDRIRGWGKEESGESPRMIKPPRDSNFSCPIINYRGACTTYLPPYAKPWGRWWCVYTVDTRTSYTCLCVARESTDSELREKFQPGIIISYVNYALIYYLARRDVLIIILASRAAGAAWKVVL